MIVLGVDTSTARLAIGLIRSGKILAEARSKSKLKHSALLIPGIKKVLDESGLEIKDVNLFAVGIGPGSFTGLRVGVTAVRGLALALNRPIVGVPSMDAIAHNAKLKRGEERIICPILDAKQGQVYACFYKIKDGKPVRVSGYLLEKIEELCGRIKSPTIFLGDGVKLYKGYIGLHTGARVRFHESENWYPKGEVIARLALERFRAGERDSVYDLVPMYIYSKECHIISKRNV